MANSTKYLFGLIVLFSLNSCVSIKFKKEKTGTEKYLETVNENLGIPEETLFYVSSESSEDFLDHLRPSLIAFVKGNQSTSIDDITGKDKNGNPVPVNSCDFTEAEVNKQYIEKFFDTDKSYQGIVLKNIKSKQQFSFPKDQIVAVVLYSKKLNPQIDPYVSYLKKLKKEEGIPYIFVTMDLEDLKDIPDIWQNTIF